MAFTVGATLAKDSGSTAIAGGLLSADIAGGGVGPTFFFHGLVDGLAGSNRAQITVGNALKVDGSAVTQPVSGTVTAAQATAASLNATVVGTGTFAVQAAATLAAETTKVIGTVNLSAAQTLATVSAVTAITNALPAGTNVLGKVGINDGTSALVLSPASSGAPAATVVAVPVTIRDVNANVQGGAPVTVGAVVPTATANGATSSRVKAAASTNATSLKASAGQLYSIDFFNNAIYAVYFKLYNKASAPTVGTDTPVWTIPVAAGGGFSREFPRGKTFATGIAYAITKLEADTDTTVVVADDLTGSLDWI